MGMKVDDALLERLAHLASLSLNPDEREVLRHRLERMLGLVDLLLLETDGDESFACEGLEACERADVVRPSLSVDDALANAASTQDGFLDVPAAVEVPK